MLRSYITIALRNLLRHKGLSFINIAGLAIGISVFMFILLFVRDEFSYDRFHTKADNIYRVYMERISGENVIQWARTPAPLGPALKSTLADVRDVVRIRKNPRTDLVRYGDKEYYEDQFYFADPSVFNVFTFPLRRGNPETALQDPHSVVLTEAIAEKYFGREDPLGKVIQFENSVDLTVTGILEEVPHNAHFRFDFLASFESLKQTIGERRLQTWAWVDHHTYVLLSDQVNPQQVEAQFHDFLTTASSERFAGRTTLRLQPLTSIHLSSKLKDEIAPNSDATYSYILLTIAAFILLIACINFMNLATARSAKRAREVGMRKVLGADRGQLMTQFFGEALLMAFAALAVALFTVWLLLPIFNDVAGKTLTLADSTGFISVAFLALTLGVGIIAGSYPALFLSSVRPIRVLKASLGTIARGASFRKVLVVGQFAISIILIIGTVVVSNQLAFFQNTTLGFEQGHVLVVPIRDSALRERTDAIKSQLKQSPRVLSVTASSSTPGTETQMTFGFKPEGAEESMELASFLVDVEFPETYALDVLEGRSFNQDIASDSTLALLLNEAAVRHFGLDDPIGARIAAFGEDAASVIGVVRDFQFKSLHNPIEPLVIVPANFYRYLSIRIDGQQVPETLAYLEEQWRSIAPDRPFEYTFLDQNMNRFYQTEAQLGRLFRYFSVLAIFIACLGLLGMASYTAEQRTREIGIRKVLGASVSGVVLLLSREFSRQVAWAVLIAWPVAYIVMSRWLEDFAYRVDLNLAAFALAGGGALVLALATVGYHAIKAALTNPTEALRHE